MYQIKFLKPLALKAVSSPTALSQKSKKSKPTHLELSSTLTISNDLGESNFYGDASLKIKTKTTLKPSHLVSSEVLDESIIKWDAGKRALNFSVVVPILKLSKDAKFISVDVSIDEKSPLRDQLNTEAISTQELVDELIPEDTLKLFNDADLTRERKSKLQIFVISSEFIELPTPITDLLVLKTERASIRRVGDIQLYEELSGNIARHLWDAGLLLIEGMSITQLFDIIYKSTTRKFELKDSLNILELGTGIGLVSINFKKKLPKSYILSTDLADAQEIFENNLELNGVSSDPSIEFKELDWEQSDKTNKPWDIIVITDCTYNPLYYDALITVLERETSKETIVVIAHKFREPLSESEFFTKISIGFKLDKCHLVDHNGQSLIVLSIYTRK